MDETTNPEVPNQTEHTSALIELVDTDFVCMQIASDGTVTTVNQMTELIYGRSVQDLAGNHWTEYVHPADVEMVQSTAEEHVDCQYRVEYRIVRPDGTVRHIKNHIRPIMDELDIVKGFVSVGVDITEQKERERGLQGYTGNLAHELNGLLGNILGYTEVLLSEDAPSLSQEQKLNALRIIATKARDMAEVIESLRLLAMGEDENIRKRFTTLDMRDIFDDVWEGLEPVILEHEVQITIPDSWPAAVGYKPWVRSALTNYISNAIKYGGNPPKIRVEAQMSEDGRELRFSIHDNGEGITEEQQSQLFIPFSRLDIHSKIEGHGLGLALVKKLIEKQDGTVGVSSKIGEGSCFWFTLPTSSVSLTELPAESPIAAQ